MDKLPYPLVIKKRRGEALIKPWQDHPKILDGTRALELWGHTARAVLDGGEGYAREDYNACWMKLGAFRALDRKYTGLELFFIAVSDILTELEEIDRITALREFAHIKCAKYVREFESTSDHKAMLAQKIGMRLAGYGLK